MLEVMLFPSDITPFFQHGCHLKLGRNSFTAVPSTWWADTHIPVTGMYIVYIPLCGHMIWLKEIYLANRIFSL